MFSFIPLKNFNPLFFGDFIGFIAPSLNTTRDDLWQAVTIVAHLWRPTLINVTIAGRATMSIYAPNSLIKRNRLLPIESARSAISPYKPSAQNRTKNYLSNAAAIVLAYSLTEVNSNMRCNKLFPISMKSIVNTSTTSIKTGIRNLRILLTVNVPNALS